MQPYQGPETGRTEKYIFFDSKWETQPHGEVIQGHASETGAVFKENMEILIQESDIIISCVTGSVALLVAEQAA